MGMSDLIASFINEILREEDGIAELQRAELANRFHCVPSQINYVISTRFSPEHGYTVESRRGGGGYIRIQRVQSDPKQLIMHTINAVGEEIDQNTTAALVSNAVSAGVLNEAFAHLILAATGNAALKPVSPEQRDAARASIFKQMLIKTL